MKHKQWWIILSGCAALACCMVTVRAQESVSLPGKTIITSDGGLTLDYRRSIAVFEDNVKVNDPELRMECDKLNLLLEGTNDVKSVTAIGNVKLWHDDILATCRRAIFQKQISEVRLLGDAVVNRGEDVLRGDEITFWLDKEIMKCTPGYIEIISDQSAPKFR